MYYLFHFHTPAFPPPLPPSEGFHHDYFYKMHGFRLREYLHATYSCFSITTLENISD